MYNPNVGKLGGVEVIRWRLLIFLTQPKPTKPRESRVGARVCQGSVWGFQPCCRCKKVLLMLQTATNKAIDGCRGARECRSMSVLNGRISRVSSVEPEHRDALVPRDDISFPDEQASHWGSDTHTHKPIYRSSITVMQISECLKKITVQDVIQHPSPTPEHVPVHWELKSSQGFNLSLILMEAKRDKLCEIQSILTSQFITTPYFWVSSFTHSLKFKHPKLVV